VMVTNLLFLLALNQTQTDLILWQVIMFLSKSDEETTSNRKLAKDLVDKWVMQSLFIS
jgi:hypothetical protein